MICLIIILSCFLNLNNLILCTAYVDPRYFAEHTGYLISSNYGDGDDDAVWAGRGPELISSHIVFLSHIAPALVSSHQSYNSIFLSQHFSSSLPNTVMAVSVTTGRSVDMHLWQLKAGESVVLLRVICSRDEMCSSMRLSVVCLFPCCSPQQGCRITVTWLACELQIHTWG